jgi:hypothetical protein
MSEPRPHLYRFAHRILPQDAQTEPKLWSFITGDKAHGYLQMRVGGVEFKFEPAD